MARLRCPSVNNTGAEVPRWEPNTLLIWNNFRLTPEISGPSVQLEMQRIGSIGEGAEQVGNIGMVDRLP